MYGSYYDESAVDGGGPVSAVGGLWLDHGQYTWLGVDWDKAVSSGGTGKAFVHMKDFGDHGDLCDFPIDKKRVLLDRLAMVINEHKGLSIGSTLTPEQYKDEFSFLRKATKRDKRRGDPGEMLSIHATCFLQAAATQGRIAERIGYKYDIPFMLDQGCPDRPDIDRAHIFFKDEFPDLYMPDEPRIVTHAGGLTWEDDTRFPALQAADVIAWAVRRKAANLPFDRGTEALESILEVRHADQHYGDEFLRDAAKILRSQIGR